VDGATVVGSGRSPWLLPAARVLPRGGFPSALGEWLALGWTSAAAAGTDEDDRKDRRLIHPIGPSGPIGAEFGEGSGGPLGVRCTAGRS